MINFERYTPSETVLSHMVEVDFPDGAEDGFRKVKETLQRMGVANRNEKKLCQTAHILHKQGRYYIAHFKLLFALDGKPAELSDSDVARMNLIVRYLKEWGMITPLTDSWNDPMGNPRMLKVLKHSEKEGWELTNKYTVGNKRVA